MISFPTQHVNTFDFSEINNKGFRYCLCRDHDAVVYNMH